MKKWAIVIILLMSACSPSYEAIPESESTQIGVYSQLDSTLSVYDESLNGLGTWNLDQPYTGMVLVDSETILFYGYGLVNADLYQLSTGQFISSFEVGEGTVSAVTDNNFLYVANSQTDEIKRFDNQFQQTGVIASGNYPMSMQVRDDSLYIVHYQDTRLTRIDLTKWLIEDEWDIPMASQGLWVDEQYIYIGGHGSGASMNSFTQVMDVKTGEVIKRLETPIMPIAFTKLKNHLYVMSHGSNSLYEVEGLEIRNQIPVAANPFSVLASSEFIYVAGYDDDTLYQLKNMEIVKETVTGDGPLQLFIREGRE